MTAVRIAILRPMDTDRMGWSQTLACEGSCGLKPWRPPADTARLNWAYIVERERCPTCSKPLSAISFKGRPEPGFNFGPSVGELRRVP